MRIDRFDLTAFGSFSNTSLDLSGGNQGLHLIYGDNEAGKSTSLRALIAWFFGIHPRTSDNYLHPNPQLRIGGKLRLLNGKELEFVRRKGTKGTLLKAGTEETLDDSVLLPFLPSAIDENLFTRLYGINHARLLSGGQELLNQSGDLGQALFSAAAGTSSLRLILSNLDAEADELYRPRASNRPVNRAIAAYRESIKKMKSASLPVSEWKGLQKKLADHNLAIAAVEKDIGEKARQKNQLDRLNRVKGALAERRELLGKLDKLQGAPLLAEDFEEQLKIARSSLATARQTISRTKMALANLDQEAANLSVRSELLDNQETILEIYKDLGAVETAIKDRPAQVGKRQQLRNDAQKLLSSVGTRITFEEAHQLRPLINNRKWIIGLAGQHNQLRQDKEKSQKNLKIALRQQQLSGEKLEQQSDSTINLKDLKDIKAVVAAARKAGDLEQRLADAHLQITTKKTACDDELSRLARFSGSLDQLLQLALPTPETIDIYEKQFDELTEEMRDNKRRQEERGEQQTIAKEELEALLLAARVPTIAELEQARTERDSNWQKIRLRYIDGSAETHMQKHSKEEANLPEIYQQGVKLVDQLANELLTAAQQVMKRADLEARLASLQQGLDRVKKGSRAILASREQLQQKWQSIWQPLSIESGSPREMKQWLLRLEKLQTNLQLLNTLQSEAKRLERDCHSHRKTVSLKLQESGITINPEQNSLEAMLNICEQKIEEQESAIAVRRELQRVDSECAAQISSLQEELERIETDQANWLAQWSQAVKGLGLQADVHPEQAVEAFEQLLAFFGKYDSAEESRRRIYGIDLVVERFEKKVLDFATSIRYPTAELNPAIIATRLNRDLTEAREARASLKKITIRQRELTEELEEAEITVDFIKQQLAEMKQQAGVEKEAELESAGEQSRIRRQLSDRLGSIETELSRSGDGLPVVALEEEARSADIDAIDSTLAVVLSELKELHQHRDRLRDERQAVENDISTRDGSGLAALASEDAEHHLATMVSGIEQHLRLRIASVILKQRIEEYRKKNQAPVLATASQLFRRLTLGAYASLRDELDSSGRPILLGVRPDNVEVDIEAMSEGTRDQLYLCLRLATLEQHLGGGEPMPFIVDDILIGFDDNRTRVCLEILTDLAATTQVLLFTHHRRVVELAREIPSDPGIFIHELLLMKLHKDKGDLNEKACNCTIPGSYCGARQPCCRQYLGCYQYRFPCAGDRPGCKRHSFYRLPG
jgi:uncharacterized protein YhaN